MNYYRLNDDIHSTQHRQLGSVLNQTLIVDADNFTSSQLFSDAGDLSVEASEGPGFDFCFAAFDVPIISKRFAELLRTAGEVDIQLIPVQILNETDYFILNSLRKLPCLDESRSLFSKWEASDGRTDRIGQYRMVTELKVSNVGIREVGIFRIEGWDVPLIVSEAIRQSFHDHHLRGGVFTSVS